MAAGEEQDVQEERQGEGEEDALAPGSGEPPSAGHQSGIQLKDMKANNTKMGILDIVKQSKFFSQRGPSVPSLGNNNPEVFERGETRGMNQ